MVKKVKLPNGTMFSGNIFKLRDTLGFAKSKAGLNKAKKYRTDYWNSRKETIVFGGKKYKVWNFAEKRKITQTQADNIVANYRAGNTTLYAQQGTKMTKFDYRNKLPLILRTLIKRPNLNSILLKGKMKGITFTQELGDKPIDILVSVKFFVNYNGVKDQRQTTLKMTIPTAKLTSGMIQQAIEETGEYTWGEIEVLPGWEQTTKSAWGQTPLEFLNQKVFRGNPLAIAHLFNEDILMNDNFAEGGSCRDYIKTLMTKVKKRNGKTFKTPFKHDVLDTCETTADYLQFAKANLIKMVVFDINGRVIAFNYSPVKNPWHLKSIVYLQYNQHIYPIKNRGCANSTTRLKANDLPPTIITLDADKIHEKAKEILHSGQLLSRVNAFGSKITSFQYNGAYYSSNTEMESCKKVLEVFGIGNELEHNTNLINIYKKHLEPLFGLEKNNSFYPGSERFTKSGFNYVNTDHSTIVEEEEPKKTKQKKEDIVPPNQNLMADYAGIVPLGPIHEKKKKKKIRKANPDVIVIDKRKAYSNELQELTYNIVLDITSSKVFRPDFPPDYKWGQDNIVEHYLYVIQPDESSVLLPNRNIYWGKCVILSKKEGLKFKVLYYYRTRREEVKLYNELIQKLYRSDVPKDDVKKIINAMIGQMEKRHDLKYFHNVEKVGNKLECDMEDGYMEYIGDCEKPCSLDYEDHDEWDAIENSEWWKEDDIWLVKKESERPSITRHNKKPIAIQIKDATRMRLYLTMKDLKLTDKDIAYIKTDSIAFIQRKRTKTKLKKLTEVFQYNATMGWRYEPVNDAMFDKTYNAYESMKPADVIPINLKNTLMLCDAGAGKSYKVINEIIPTLDNDYMVLSASHSALREYRKLGLNAEVVDKFKGFAGKPDTYPTQRHIICEEFGMFDGGHLRYIYSLALLGHHITALGDYGQLLPVKINWKKPLSGQDWIDLMFHIRTPLLTNYRNDFTPEYYASLRDGTPEYGQAEMKKHRTKTYKDAKVIITYRNTTRHKYNKMKCDDLEIPYKMNEKFGSIHFDPANLPPKGTTIICKTNKHREEGLYNKYVLQVVKYKEDKVYLRDEDDAYIIPIAKFMARHGDYHKHGNMNFEFGYARTLYSVQGESIEDGIYYPDEDLNQLTPRGAYTLISRIKTK